MNTLGSVLSWLFDHLLAPVAGAPLAALLVVSAVAGVVMTVVFRYTSNQRALRAVADRSRGHLLAMRLFKDDLVVAFRTQAALLGTAVLRLWYAVPPMLVLLAPFVLVVVQLALRYEHRPLARGESAVVEVAVTGDAWPRWREATLLAPDGVAIETPALRDDRDHTLTWRVGVLGEPAGPLRWRTPDGETVERRLAAAGDPQPIRRVEPLRPGSGFIDRLLHPGAPGFDAAAPVRSIAVQYPRRTTPVLGFDVPWWATFLVASMVMALIVRPFFRVQF